MSKKPSLLLLAALMGAAIGLPAAPAHAAPTAPTPKPWVSLAWDNDVGRIVGNESDSEGPKSFALEPDGGVLLLDQVNQRILDLDAQGLVSGIIDLPAPTFDDVELFEGRAILALDRLVTKTLRVMDRGGKLLANVALEGRGIERGGLITALLPRPDGVWLEVQHRYSVKVLDRQLIPCDRVIVLGRPAVNGLSLLAALDGHGGASISLSRRNERAASRTVTLTGQAPIRRIVWTDVDARGQVHAVLHEAKFSPVSPYRVQSERYWLVVLDDQLRELRRTESPWVLTKLDQRVEFRVGPDGRMWQMAFTPAGVQIVAWDRGAK